MQSAAVTSVCYAAVFAPTFDGDVVARVAAAASGIGDVICTVAMIASTSIVRNVIVRNLFT